MGVFLVANEYKATESVTENKPEETTTIIEVAEVEKEPTTYQEAFDLSKKKKKMLLMIFKADWCYYCEKLENNTLNKSELKEDLSKFVVYKLDIDKEPEIYKKYNGEGIPAYYLINNEEKIHKQGKGYLSVEDFKAWLRSW